MRHFSLSLMIALLGLSVGAQPQLGIKVATAEVHCTGQEKVITVTFDRSLSGILLDAFDKVQKAGSQDAEKYFGERLKQFVAKVEALSPETDQELKTIYLLAPDGQQIVRLKPKEKLLVTNPTNWPDFPTRFETISYVPTNNYDPTKSYLFVLATEAKNTSTTLLAATKSCETQAPANLPAPTYQAEYKPSRPYKEVVAAVTAKDEAMVFADFAFDSRKENNEFDSNTHSFTGNLSFVPVRIKKLGFAGNYEIQPFFYELKVNDKGKENSYISNLGSKVRYIRVFGDDGPGFNNDRRNRFLPGLVTDVSAKLEMNDFFDGMNLVGEIKPILPINIYQSRARMLRFDPYLGYTFGKQIKESSRSETQIPRGTLSRLNWINRPMAGLEFTYSEFRDRIIKPSLTIGYVIRWPLEPEDIYGKSADGTNTDIFLGQSTLPRDYFNARIDLDVGTIVTPFISYESGRLPPDYKFINGQIKVGVSVKFKKQ